MVELSGEKVDDTVVAKAIDKFLVERWKRISQKGLSPDQRTELLKKYPHPENFWLLTTPSLNVEVESVTSTSVKSKDNA